MLNWGGPPILAIVIPENRQDEERDTFYLAELGWPKGQVGVALAVGTIAGLIAHIPGGALVDWAPWKRGLAAAGIVMIAGSAIILALAPTFALVFAAQILHGLASGLIMPAIAAISLGLVGRRAMSARTGRNYGFDAAGNALTAGAMGLAGCISQRLQYSWARQHSAFLRLSRWGAYGPTKSTMLERAMQG
jgi:MFS family permease